jgi:beta-N-acetylhexosaminidase
MNLHALPLEAQVAQLFMVGYSGGSPNPITRRFIEHGLGGLIFFRDNFDELTSQTPQAVWDVLHDLQNTVPAAYPKLLMGIDQEGGQVERLPHTVFPTGLSPRAIALAPNADRLAKAHYAAMAQRLVSLGFNLDFFPTLDVNFQHRNPIIGVRSFGDEPETVWRFAQIACEAFVTAGLIAVGKHFPGHGNGTVDSHLDLPTLHFTPEELQPFQQAMQAGLPAMLVAHGYYPALQTTETERNLPSSASPAVIQNLLREQCGFEGVVITDDLCMGAITKHRSPVEAAIASLKAGVDILLYKQSTEAEWEVYQAVVQAFQSGHLPLSLLEQSMTRIAKLKAHYIKPMQPLEPQQWQASALTAEADSMAEAAISVLSGDSNCLPAPENASLLVIHPDRSRMGNYAFDVPASPDLAALFRQSAAQNLFDLTYPPREAFSATETMKRLPESAFDGQSPDLILFVTFNALLQNSQVELYELLKARFPNTPIILASAGTPYDQEMIPKTTLHLGLCSYRPATMRALVKALKNGLPNPALFKTDYAVGGANY